MLHGANLFIAIVSRIFRACIEPAPIPIRIAAVHPSRGYLVHRRSSAIP